MEEQVISFETAKLAKEKEFKEECLHYYFEDAEFRQHKIEDTYGYYGEEYTVEYEELLNNWNDKFLIKKNGDRCFGCKKTNGYLETFSAPTQSLLQKWLREEHRLHICIAYGDLSNKYMGDIMSHDGKMLVDIECIHDTYEDALEEGLQEALKLVMKKSEEYEKKAAQEDNDLKALGLYTKSLKEGRLENFKQSYLPLLLKRNYEVAKDNNKYTIDTYSEFGILDFFPKANKILIRKDNKWIKPGLQWIIKNLIIKT